jgi:hypothetical protein
VESRRICRLHLYFSAPLLFLVNVFVPDAFPFIDELLLGLIAVVLGRLKRPAGGKAAKDDDPE